MSGETVAVVPEGLLDEGVWFRVEAAGTASAVRRTAERLAADLAMPERRIAELSIVAAEAAGNLVKHAQQGVMLVRTIRTPEQAGVELIAIDSGPGMADVQHAIGDGHSTAGTLGIGLGAILRQASRWDLYSLPGKGTVLTVQVWPLAAPPQGWAAGLTRPMSGETVCGDAFASREVDGRHQLLVSDGLGHGGLAAAASHEAVRVFRQTPAGSPSAVVEALHRSIGHTRGAALAVAELDPVARVVRYAGLGNITGTVFSPDGSRRGMVSMPGIAGHQRRQIRQFDYPLPDGAIVLMHSDGVVDRWKPAEYPGLLTRSPELIAATVLRDAGTRRDDAGVLVARLT
ncbi:SpoIIE family protein phosphatase [Actinoplanes awajinensis]|uniref:Transcriptional regulator n=1 Tax=Actinoplanes awajinensis subsp. mycoplanecinus TaxID=135947 RepID=A0A0X3V309_9ACTN|nr:SpoIIE family protein phosphatase [Actinoplanes awajinensis]KUL39084.1 transcriptional regulator [Actinoplanes awajinensis subsp. mycoplanecinus]